MRNYVDIYGYMLFEGYGRTRLVCRVDLMTDKCDAILPCLLKVFTDSRFAIVASAWMTNGETIIRKTTRTEWLKWVKQVRTVGDGMSTEEYKKLTVRGARV